MKTRLLQVLCALLFGVSLCGFAQEEAKASSVRERDRQEVPKQYLAGRVWLTPEMYRQIDDAVRSGKRANADGILKSGRAKQKADKSAFRSRLPQRKGKGTIVFTRDQAGRVRAEGMPAVLSKEKHTGSQSSAALPDSEDPAQVIPSPADFYFKQAFYMRIAGDGGGMAAYANAAITAFSEVVNAPEGEASKEQRMEALLKTANLQTSLLSDWKGARESWARALELDPDNEELKTLLENVQGKEVR